MALIQCPECGKKISDKAKFCPGCGYRKKKEKKSLLRYILICVVIILVLICFVIWFYFFRTRSLVGLYPLKAKTVTQTISILDYNRITDFKDSAVSASNDYILLTDRKRYKVHGIINKYEMEIEKDAENEAYSIKRIYYSADFTSSTFFNNRSESYIEDNNVYDNKKSAQESAKNYFSKLLKKSVLKYGVPYEQDEINNTTGIERYSYTWKTDIPSIYYMLYYRDWGANYSDDPIYVSYGYIKKND